MSEHLAVDQAVFVVLVNEEEQYSIWPKGRPVPSGWRTVFGESTREDCLAYVEEFWTDMRPKSLRDSMVL